MPHFHNTSYQISTAQTELAYAQAQKQFDEADILRTKIGKLISEHRSCNLSQVDYKSSKELWATVNPTL